jgi:hypothetical protein
MKFDVFGSGWETKEFPSSLCVRKCTEVGILEAVELFLCIVWCTPWNRFEVRILRPYTAERQEWDEEYPGNPLFGWASPRGEEYVDHFENNVHGDDHFVVAWRPVSEDFKMVDLLPDAGVSDD